MPSLRQTFDGFDLLALAAGGEGQARTDQAAVDDDAARAAHADAATFFGAGEIEGVAQHLQQQPIGFDFDFVVLAVDGERHLLFHV